MLYMSVYDCICCICDYVCIKSRPPSLTLTTLNPGRDFCDFLHNTKSEPPSIGLSLA